MKPLMTLSFLIFFLSSCISSFPFFNKRPPITEKFNGTFTRVPFKFLTTIHFYESADQVINSYIIELPWRIVIFDAQFTLSGSKEVLKYAQLLGKPIERLIISHRHVDHWYGSITFKGKTKISTFEEIVNLIRDQGQSLIDRDTLRRPAETPKTLVVPDTLQKEGFELINLIPFYFIKLNNTESSTMLILQLPFQKVLIAADLLFSRTHLFLSEKKFNTWIDVLESLKNSFEGYKIFVGHGKPSDSRLFQENIDYLKFVIQAYDNSEYFAEFKKSMIQQFPDYKLPFILDLAESYLYPKTK